MKTSQEILQTMINIVNKKEYQPGYPKANGEPATHCNEAAVDIIETLGFDSRHFLNPGGVGYTNANDMYRNARYAILKRGLESITESEAQAFANNNGCIIVLAFNINGGYGHVAIVAPETAPYKKGKGCAIVQAGSKNGRMNREDAFDFVELSAPLFVKCRRKI